MTFELIFQVSILWIVICTLVSFLTYRLAYA